MKNRINQFSYRHPDFGVMNLMKYIAIANAVFWILNFIVPSFVSYLAFNPYYIFHGQIWRIVSFVFFPPSTSILGAVAIYFYYVIGNVLEARWGTAKFNLFVLSGVLMTMLYGFLVYFLLHVSISLTAEYIFLSMFFAFALLFPDTQVLYMFLVPIKMKWLALLDLAFFVFDIFTRSFPSNLLPLIAILNVLLFCGIDDFKNLFRK